MVRTLRYDVFISHAVEDKISIANDLNKGLRLKGLHTWYSGQELRVGDSIVEAIEKGLKASACGIVIISPHFFPSQWQKDEMSALLRDRKKIFLVLHNVSRQDLRLYDPSLTNEFILSSVKDTDEIVDQLTSRIREEIAEVKGKISVKKKWINRIILVLLFILGTTAVLYRMVEFQKKSAFKDKIEKTVKERIKKVEGLIETRLYHENLYSECSAPGIVNVCSAISKFSGTRFGFSFEDGIHKRIDHKINVKNNLGIPIDKWQLCQSFDLQESECIFSYDCGKSGTTSRHYYFSENDSLQYSVDEIGSISETRKFVVVNYIHFIRSVIIEQEYIPGQGKGFTQTSIIGVLPVEIYNFRKEGSDWELESIQSQLGK